MDRDQQRSFIARLTCDGMNLTYFDNIITTFEVFNRHTGKMRRTANNNTTAIVVHFRCYDDYYNLQILSEPFYLKYFSKNPDGILGAFPAAGGDTTSYNMLDGDHDLITLDDFAPDTSRVYLKARNARLIRKSILPEPILKSCFTDTEGDVVEFRLEILETQVGVPSSAMPYT